MAEQIQRTGGGCMSRWCTTATRNARPDRPEDRGGTADLRSMIRHMARALRQVGYKVTVVPLARDLFAFQRRLRRLAPDVVFNQYDDVVHGALYEMRLSALVRMMGFPDHRLAGPGPRADALQVHDRQPAARGGNPHPLLHRSAGTPQRRRTAASGRSR